VRAAAGESYRVGGDSGGFVVEGVSLQLAVGEVVAVVGAVGSGKSTLLEGLQGNAEQIGGASVELRSVELRPSRPRSSRTLSERDGPRGGVAFAAQNPFILNASLRDNVLFGRPFEESRYAAALEAAALVQDLKLLPAGDLTEIGEVG
jgi:ABC-type transport system involved in cytochrome bd biosynthesis fused ATPase/permease subunit